MQSGKEATLGHGLERYTFRENDFGGSFKDITLT